MESRFALRGHSVATDKTTSVILELDWFGNTHEFQGDARRHPEDDVDHVTGITLAHGRAFRKLANFLEGDARDRIATADKARRRAEAEEGQRKAEARKAKRSALASEGRYTWDGYEPFTQVHDEVSGWDARPEDGDPDGVDLMRQWLTRIGQEDEQEYKDAYFDHLNKKYPVVYTPEQEQMIEFLAFFAALGEALETGAEIDWG